MLCKTCGLFAPYVSATARCIPCGGELRPSADDYLDDTPIKIVDEVRPAQVRMAQAVEEAVLQARGLVAEAGTGTGKSFAVLIPAILAGKRTVVSTATTLLQQQYSKFALDYLAQKLEDVADVSFAVAKGKRHYLCPVRYAKMWDKVKPRGGFKTAQQRKIYQAVNEWATETDTGDKEDLDEHLKKLGATCPDYFGGVSAEECTGATRCPQKDNCGYVKSRVAIENAQIIIANHMIVGLNARLGGRLLPEHSIYIMDEAHKAEEYFRKAFGSTLTQSTVTTTIHRVEEATPVDDEVDEALKDLKNVNDALFARVIGMYDSVSIGGNGSAGKMVISGASLEDDLSGVITILGRLQQRLNELILLADPDEEDDAYFLDDMGVDSETKCAYLAAQKSIANTTRKEEGEEGEEGEDEERVDPDEIDVGALRFAIARTERLKQTMYAMKTTTEGESNYVLYIEKYYTSHHEARYQLILAPIRIGDILRTTLYPMCSTVIQTSATMSIGGDFSYYKEDMGLDGETPTFIAPSPFNYKGRTMLYLPRHLPIHPNNQNPRPVDKEEALETYNSAIAKEIARLVNISKGCAFVLFSARSEMDEMYERVKDMVRYPCRVQSVGAATGSLETWYKGASNPVLFATKSFWEGVSIEGKQLRMVIIPKVPFPSPSDPIMEKKKEQIIERYGVRAWFMKLYFPSMVMDVLQGLGRLMRRTDDFGIAAILDTRVIPGAPGAKYYGQRLVQSLPFTNATHDIDRIRIVMENMEKGVGPF